ncbi:hypothetical protein L6164_008459 [Bauhinia variegata]|uniref:Uncharacterized protein n=1 Tax=Bauhinia variegata TaxID=167791 RepID=A0ACB9PGK3_BAUVA|nr:hypothetical protein L6164_008459 [Bauhinia variegata]
MENEKDAFYVVRKGDVVGIYKNFTDIPVSDGSLRIYKGYHLPKTAEEYLVSHGLKEATYSLSATDVYEGLFGRIVACPYRHPYSSGEKTNDLNSPPKRLDFQGTVQYDVRNYSSGGKKSEVNPPMRSHGAVQSDRSMIGSSSTNSQRHHVLAGTQSDLSTCLSCTLVFDGAAKGNPGPAGAGAVLRAEDGSKVCISCNNFEVMIFLAKFRSLRGVIAGLSAARRSGF